MKLPNYLQVSGWTHLALGEIMRNGDIICRAEDKPSEAVNKTLLTMLADIGDYGGWGACTLVFNKGDWSYGTNVEMAIECARHYNRKYLDIKFIAWRPTFNRCPGNKHYSEALPLP